jgi:hypothetical protein
MAKSTGTSGTAYYARYKQEKRWESNRLKKLERALKKNPENSEQIKLAMKGIVYRRKTPSTKVWSSSTRRMITLFKKFTGRATLDLVSSNEKVRAEALMFKKTAAKVSLGAQNMSLLYLRAHTKDGTLVWG